MEINPINAQKLIDLFNKQNYITRESAHDQFIDRIISHDYSYQWSDDHRVWSRGQASYDLLCAQVHGLITEFGYNPQELLNECLEVRSEQFRDGLTHNIIRGLFKPYLKD